MESRLKHIDSVSKSLRDLFASGFFLDISLTVATHSIRCNRLLLAASSDYFQALLKFDESAVFRDKFFLEAEYLTARGVQHVVNYIHSLGLDYTSIPVEEYADVYAASSFLQVISLQQRIRDLVVSSLSVDNALWFLQFSAMFGDQEIYRQALSIVQDRFYSLDFSSLDYLELPSTQIEFIFLGDEINVSQEAFMVKALLCWVAHDQEKRMDFFEKNFSALLRLSMVSADDLRQIVKDPAFSKMDAALHLLMRWFFSTYGSPLFSDEQLKDLPSHTLALISKSILNASVEGHTPHISQAGQLFLLLYPGSESARVGTDFRIYSVGGLEDESLLRDYTPDRSFRCNTDFYAYSSDLKKIVHCPPLPGTPRIYHGIAASHTWIYLTGGQLEDGTILDSCERFNLVENAWYRIAHLDAPRFHHGLACLDGIVYLFGGYRLDSATSELAPSDSVLTYNHVTNQWIKITPSLPKEIVDMTVVSIPCRDLIILLGGLERDEAELHCTDSVLAFSSSFYECTPGTVEEGGDRVGATCDSPSMHLRELYTANWRHLGRMLRPLRNAAGVYHEPGDTVYLVGGRLYNDQPTNEIFAFSVFQEQWSFVTTLAIPRYGCSALIHRGKLYVLGGQTLAHLLDAPWHTFHIDDGHDHDHHHHHRHQSQPHASTSSLLGGHHAPISGRHVAHVDQPLTIRLLATFDNPLHQMRAEDLTDPVDEDEPQPSTSTAGHQQTSSAPSSSSSSSSPPSSFNPSVLSISPSWNSLYPRAPGDPARFTRLVQPNIRTCYIPEIWRLVSTVERAMPLSPVLPLRATANRPFDQPDTTGVEAAPAAATPSQSPPRSPRRLPPPPPRGFDPDPFAPYWLDPIRIEEVMGSRRRGSSLTPTLRRVRCLARYCLAPFFATDPETPLPNPTQAPTGNRSLSTGSVGMTARPGDKDNGDNNDRLEDEPHSNL